MRTIRSEEINNLSREVIELTQTWLKEKVASGCEEETALYALGGAAKFILGYFEKHGIEIVSKEKKVQGD